MTTRREDEVGGMQRTGSRDGRKEDACSGLLGSTQEVEREEDGNVGREEDGRRTGGRM